MSYEAQMKQEQIEEDNKLILRKTGEENKATITNTHI